MIITYLFHNIFTVLVLYIFSRYMPNHLISLRIPCTYFSYRYVLNFIRNFLHRNSDIINWQKSRVHKYIDTAN